MDAETVKKVAQLAKLELSDKENQSYANQLLKVLGFFKEIEQINTSEVLPLTTPVEIELYMRSDEIKNGLTTKDELMKNAPDKQGYLFKVPPVV